MSKAQQLLNPEVFPGSVVQPSFKIAVLFDCEEAQRHAESTCAFVEAKIGGESALASKYFNFRLLKGRNLTEAAKAAQGADMIVVSLQHSNEPTPELRNWVDRWVKNRTTEGGALVALLPVIPAFEDESGLVPFLQRTATQAKLDFLCRTVAPH
jgi:hypothetical protein